ncbi:hypothetical protein ABZ078_21165 [Streptomyces sp. NPDC006385]
MPPTEPRCCVVRRWVLAPAVRRSAALPECHVRWRTVDRLGRRRAEP